MTFSVSTQPKEFVFCVFLGGCIYLIYRLTHLVPADGVRGAICDVVFCLFAFSAFAAGLLFVCWGRLRLYSVAGAALGFWLAKKCWGACIDIFALKLYNLSEKARQKAGKRAGKNKE